MDLEDELREKLKNIYGDELENKIRDTKEKYLGLLTDSAALKLLAVENKLISEEVLNLKEVKTLPCTIIATIRDVFPIVEKNNKKMRKLLLNDIENPTYSKPVFLWGPFAETPFKIGDVVEIKGIYCQDGNLNLVFNYSIVLKDSGEYFNPKEAKGKTNIYGVFKSGKIEGIPLNKSLSVQEGSLVLVENCFVAENRISILKESRILVKKHL